MMPLDFLIKCSKIKVKLLFRAKCVVRSKSFKKKPSVDQYQTWWRGCNHALYIKIVILNFPPRGGIYISETFLVWLRLEFLSEIILLLCNIYLQFNKGHLCSIVQFTTCFVVFLSRKVFAMEFTFFCFAKLHYDDITLSYVRHSLGKYGLTSRI